MMVTRWGLSDELGTVSYGENQEEVFLGHPVSRQQNVSEQTAQKIDSEIRRLVETGLPRRAQILTEQARRAREAGAGPARIRDADRRRDQGPAGRQAAGARIGDEPTTPRSSAVPPAGKQRPRPEPPTGEVAPQPQA